MIHKIHYYFTTENFTSEMKDNIEEIKQEAREKIKNTENKCFIFRVDSFTVVDKRGDLIYNSHSAIREFEAEQEVNDNV
jgi:hypothetical protein